MKPINYISERVKLYAFGCFVTFLALSFILNRSNNSADFLNISLTVPNSTHTNLQIFGPKQNPVRIEEEKCDIFDGEWIHDPDGSPIYDSDRCPFLSEQVSCQRNGRRDFDYEKWNWKPKGCHILRNNTGKEMLEKLRGKRAVIVGDSLNRNQWESLACILYTALPHSRSDIQIINTGGFKAFKSKEYNCSVEFYWSPFLVQFELNKTDGKRVLKLDTISATAEKWRGADIMVFNTGHWWTHLGKSQSWDSFSYKGNATENMEIGSALGLALKTWSLWVRKNVDPTKTRVFFRSVSPEHKGKQWCYNQTRPIMDESFITLYPPIMRQQVENTMVEMKSVVTYLNITKLSEYRKDAHPSIYRAKDGEKRLAKIKPEKFADCSHWCLPGLPDTWNRLLFASISLETSTNITSF